MTQDDDPRLVRLTRSFIEVAGIMTTERNVMDKNDYVLIGRITCDLERLVKRIKQRAKNEHASPF